MSLLLGYVGSHMYGLYCSGEEVLVMGCIVHVVGHEVGCLGCL